MGEFPVSFLVLIGIAATEKEIYVTDGTGGHVQVFDHHGRFIRKWKAKPIGKKSYVSLTAISLLSRGIGYEIYVIDDVNNRVYVLDQTYY